MFTDEWNYSMRMFESIPKLVEEIYRVGETGDEA